MSQRTKRGICSMLTLINHPRGTRKPRHQQQLATESPEIRGVRPRRLGGDRVITKEERWDDCGKHLFLHS